jgi:hypothetical protein
MQDSMGGFCFCFLFLLESKLLPLLRAIISRGLKESCGSGTVLALWLWDCFSS